MRIRRVVGVVAVILGLPLAGLICHATWEKAHMVYPGLENESAFLRGYDSKAVVRPFMVPEDAGDALRGSGGGAGVKFVTHSARFNENFAMRADQKKALMEAVRDDISQRLLMSGAQIINQSGTPSTGFRFAYKTGKTIGSGSVRPLGPRAIRRNMPLPEGLEDVALSMEFSEQWFPKGIPPGVTGLLPEGAR